MLVVSATAELAEAFGVCVALLTVVSVAAAAVGGHCTAVVALHLHVAEPVHVAEILVADAHRL